MSTFDNNSSASVSESAILSTFSSLGLLSDSSSPKDTAKRQELQKAAYHNAELLLKNYRNIIWQMECEVDQIAVELELPLRNLDAVLSRIDAHIGMEDKRLENKLDQLAQLRKLIDRVNDALTLLKKKPDNGQKLYDLIYLTFISEDKLSQNDILYRLDISRRHFYRLREQAIQVISLRLWSAPTRELEMWLKLLR